MNFPLPARPQVSRAGSTTTANSQTQPPQSNHPLPQRSHLSNGAPSSPRPQTPLSNLLPPSASGARSPGARTPSGSGLPSPRNRTAPKPTVDQPLALPRPRLSPQKLRTNQVKVPLGEGWTVEWRAWTGPAVLSSSGSPLVGPTESVKAPTTKYDPSAPNSSTGQPVGKRLLDELAAAESAASKVSTPVASTSAAQPQPPQLKLKDRLESLHATANIDPIELARAQVIEAARTLSASSSAEKRAADSLALFAHVEVDTEPELDLGKGKAKEDSTTSSPAVRTLWVFSIVKRPTAVAGLAIDGLDEAPPTESTGKSSLAHWDFPGLQSLGEGDFGHRNLFPTLYPTPPVSPPPSMPTTPSAESATSATTALALKPQPSNTFISGFPPGTGSYTSPLSCPAHTYPSALQLSSVLLRPLASQMPDFYKDSALSRIPTITKAHNVFLAGAKDTLIASLVSDAPAGSTINSRLGETLVALPPPSVAFGSEGRRITASAVQTSVTLSIQRAGILVQSIINDVALRPWPAVGALPPVDAPLRLAPQGIEATFVQAYPPLPSAGSDAQASPAQLARSQLRESWDKLLLGTGLALGAKEESWIVCRLSLPSTASPAQDLPSPPSSPDSPPASAPAPEMIDVLWPSSLVILDGAKPQPPRSPRGTPAKTTIPLAAEDELVRRSFVSSVRRRSSAAEQPYRDALAMRIDQASRVLSGLEEQDKERIAKEKEEAAAAAKAALASTPAPTAVDAKSVAVAPHAGAPVNMRTPISLGGSSTEAPSPADGFGPLDRVLGLSNSGSSAPMTGLVFGTPNASDGNMALPIGSGAPLSLEQLYPSPSDPSDLHNPPANHSDQPMALPGPLDHQTIESAFPDFDWGDDFASGPANQRGQSNGAGADFDDGMMMGLTDDDFSFFDDPAPLPMAMSLPMTAPGLQSTETSPKFVDHFTHLSAGTPFVQQSPTSPFGQSPHAHPPGSILHQHVSPNLLAGFPFDPTNNALGLGSATPAGLGPETGSPFKTPRTPYTPFIDLADADDEDEPSDHPTVGPTGHALSVAGTPAAGLARGIVQGSRFQPISFGGSHAKADAKYDPRKGKFGLPSPESEGEAALPSPPLALEGAAKGSWWARVCDPRVAVAVELRKKRKPSLARVKANAVGTRTAPSLGRAELRKSLPPRGWLSEAHAAGSPYPAATVDESSSDESMDLDEPDIDDESVAGDRRVELSSTGLDVQFGAALLLLGNHLERVLKPAAPPPPPRPILTAAAAKAASAADSAMEATVSLVADQVMYNPDYRKRLVDARVARAKVEPSKIVSSHAIKLAADRLANLALGSAADLTAAKDEELQSGMAPSILLRAQQSVLQTSPTALSYWRPMAFEPLAGGKDLVAFAVYEEGGADLTAAVAEWLSSVTEAYEGARLGKHALGSLGTIDGGLAPVPAGALCAPRQRNKDELKPLCALLTEAARAHKHIVVYLLTPPGPIPTSPDSPSAQAVQQLLKSRSGTMSMVVYPVPLGSVALSRTLPPGESTASRLTRLAFSVYDQLLIPVARLYFPVPETFPTAQHHPLSAFGTPSRLFQCAAITLSPSRPTRLEFELSWPPSSLEVEHRHRFLHIAYTCVSVPHDAGVEWIVVSMVDEKGEMWKTLPRLLRYPQGALAEVIRARAVWSMARMLADTADIEWRLVITRLGAFTAKELQAWEALLREQLELARRPLHVSLLCADLAPPVSVLATAGKIEKTDKDSPLFSPEPGTIEEEGELIAEPEPIKPTVVKPAHLDTEPSTFTFTPSEPVTIAAGQSLVAPSSIYLIHVPRLPTLAHTTVDPFMAATSQSSSNSSSALSVVGIHFMLGRGTRLSTLKKMDLATMVRQVGQSLTEMAALGRARWGSSGRVPWHLDAVGQIVSLLEEVGDQHSE